MNKPASGAPRTRGRRRAAPDLDGRERLLDRATELFAAQGIAATTMAQIASAADVTSAMVHYYFKNRETLLDIVVEERIARAIHFVWQVGEAQVQEDAAQLAHQLADRLFDVTGRMPWLPSLWLREVVNEGGMLRERLLARIPMDNLRRFAHRIEVAQRAGNVNPDIEAPFLFLSILGLVMLPLATATIWQGLQMPKLGRAALQRHVAALLTSGLQPAAGAQGRGGSKPARSRA
jgi:AcrR family transcriptional regulator